MCYFHTVCTESDNIYEWFLYVKDTINSVYEKRCYSAKFMYVDVGNNTKIICVHLLTAV